LVRLLETGQDWAVVAVNHQDVPAHITISFDAAFADPASMSITIPAGTGTVQWSAKRRQT